MLEFGAEMFGIRVVEAYEEVHWLALMIEDSHPLTEMFTAAVQPEATKEPLASLHPAVDENQFRLRNLLATLSDD